MLNKEKSEALYHELALKLNELVPVQWDRILLYSEVQVGAVSIYYVYLESESQKFKEMSSLCEEHGLNRREYLVGRIGLSSIVSRLNEAFVEEGEQSWTTMTFILNNDGKFKVEFGYEDLEATDEIKRREVWEAKYL